VGYPGVDLFDVSDSGSAYKVDEMKALKLRISEELYERFKRLHPAYGEESQKFRELLEEYVTQEERKQLNDVSSSDV
jgi:predicted DNA-binding protein